MKVCIHRGSKEIGGTCVEIESQGKRLVLDVGLPLDASDSGDLPLHPVRGFAEPDPSLKGVVISHPHQDHYGLACRLPEETLFLIGQAAERILSAAALFSPSGQKLKNVVHLRDRRPVVLEPFTITPFLVDHSAYDSYAVLIEAEGKRLFYTGDFRFHGRKADRMTKLLANPPGGVNVLLMEGTSIGRGDQVHSSEEELVGRFAGIFRSTEGMPLVWCSGQNLDRIVTIFKACLASKRQFIIDMYTAEVLRATGNARLPQADWRGVRVFLPDTQKWTIMREKAFAISDRYRLYRIHRDQLAGVASRSVMLFRPSMARDLDAANCLDGGCVVHSVWEGHLQGERNQWFMRWMRDRALPLVRACHVSGHAYTRDLKRMREAFPKAVAVPVHLQDREGFSALLGNVRLHDDGEWWEV